MTCEYMMNIRKIGYCSFGLPCTWLFVAIATTLPLIGSLIFRDMIILGVGFALGAVMGFLMPFLMGHLYLKGAESSYGEEIANEVYRRFLQVKWGEAPEFTFQDVVRENATKGKRRVSEN